MFNFLKGYRTYISAGALAAFAIYGMVTGHLDFFNGMTLLAQAGTASGIRAAIPQNVQDLLVEIISNLQSKSDQ